MSVATPNKKQSETKVTRIKASDDKPVKKTIAKKTATKPARAAAKPVISDKPARRNPLAPVVRYVRGSWFELRQVRWPDRRSTWGMTGALIVFTLAFVLIIVLLDAAFSELFNYIIGK